jgi:hypothetical protein
MLRLLLIRVLACLPTHVAFHPYTIYVLIGNLHSLV